jgi:hypothetical protein
MVCLRNIRVDTIRKGHIDDYGDDNDYYDDYDNDDNDNNNNNNTSILHSYTLVSDTQ